MARPEVSAAAVGPEAAGAGVGVAEGAASLGGLAQKNGFQGPVIGAKMATEAPRDFTDAQAMRGNVILFDASASARAPSAAFLADATTLLADVSALLPWLARADAA